MCDIYLVEIDVEYKEFNQATIRFGKGRGTS